MSIFRLPRFLRRFIRRHTQYMPEVQALAAKKKLSIVYAVITWHVLGYLVYKVIKDQQNPEKRKDIPTKKWWEGNVYGMDKPKNVVHYRIEGFKLIEVPDSDVIKVSDSNKSDSEEEEEEKEGESNI